ncbi:MAG TPA: V4R domain-containing protein [Gemmatimonadaceae bacterium]
MDLPSNAMVGLTRDGMTALRAALWRDAGAAAPGILQEAGYASGPAMYQAFVAWCAHHGYGVPEQVAASNFQQLATTYFHELGWGTVAVTTVGDSVVTVDSADWAEADPASAMQFPGCYLSSGMLADFFGRLAGAQLTSMEVECRSMGHAHCRFILGSAETIQHVYDAMTQGIGYEDALAQMA